MTGGQPSPDPHVLSPETWPTPFTAEEIRRGCPSGRTIHLRVETAGEPDSYRLNRFVECDATGAVIARSEATAAGEPVGPVETDRSTWHALQRHASFPIGRTTRAPEAIDTPMGRLDCLRYTRTDGDAVADFWFAVDLPGMPVRVTTTVAGTLVSTVTMQSSRPDRAVSPEPP